MQPRHQATLTQPVTTMRSAETELQNAIELRATASEIAAPKPRSRRKAEKDEFEALFKRIFERKITSAKIRKSADKSLSQPGCSHSNTIYDLQLQKTTQAAAAPSNLDAAITMRFAASRCKPARIYAHGNTRRQQSCSHSNAICSHRFLNTLQLRTHKHTQSRLKPPLQCGAKKRQTDRSRTRRTQEVPFIAACRHFTRKNPRFRASGFLPTRAPCNIHAAIAMHFAPPFIKVNPFVMYCYVV